MKHLDLLDRAGWHLDESNRCGQLGAFRLAGWHRAQARKLMRKVATA